MTKMDKCENIASVAGNTFRNRRSPMRDQTVQQQNNFGRKALNVSLSYYPFIVGTPNLDLLGGDGIRSFSLGGGGRQYKTYIKGVFSW